MPDILISRIQWQRVRGEHIAGMGLVMTIPFLSISDRYELSRRILEEEKRCFHPDAPNGCSPEGPIKSHSISKGMSLASIAEAGYVISIAKPFDDIVFEDKAILEPKGIKVSSIFPGFCKKHDSELFSLIETEGWNLNKASCFLLSYRSLSNTVLNSRIKIRYFEHMNSIDSERFDSIRDHGFSGEDIKRDYDFGVFARRYLFYQGQIGKDTEIDDVVRRQYVAHAEWRASIVELNPYLKVARSFDDDAHLGKMRNMFFTGDCSQFRFVAVRYNYILPFAASKNIVITIKSGGEESVSFATLNVCSNKTDSFIVFGWIEDGGTAKDYIDTITMGSENRIINRVLGYIFKNPTNTFFQKSWWNSLAEETRHHILSYHDDELNAFPYKVQSESEYRIFIPEFPPSGRLEG
ncbi:hypothetical protein NKH94_24725 [Mesorhizobium australicum]|uniref:hypothetical protein n=1 Tax=Mesorhizobium australicum TaxID=536018 RepID=UPI00333DDF68